MSQPFRARYRLLPEGQVLVERPPLGRSVEIAGWQELLSEAAGMHLRERPLPRALGLVGGLGGSQPLAVGGLNATTVIWAPKGPGWAVQRSMRGHEVITNGP
jgi:hypothetical protein